MMIGKNQIVSFMI